MITNVSLRTVLWAAVGMASLSDPSRQGPPAGARVISAVTVNASIGDYRGACPAKVVFTGTITAAAIPKGPIVYQWVRSDKTTSPRHTIRMTATTAKVTDKWQGGRSGEQMRFWEKLQIVAPEAALSSQADVAVLCH